MMKAKTLWVMGMLLPMMASAWAAPTYQEDMRPLFKENCFKCHNADKKKGDVDLSSFAAIMAGGSSGEIVEVGSPDSSLLYLVVTHEEDPTMPPKKSRMADDKLKLIKDWIAQGADFGGFKAPDYVHPKAKK